MAHIMGSQVMPQMGQQIPQMAPQPQPQQNQQLIQSSSNPNPNALQTQQTQQSNTEQKYDLIARVRQLVWSLKESLANLMRISAANIQHNSQIDSGLKTSEESVARFDKALEDFFSTCNQIELNLKTIMECAIQARDSQTFLPFNVSPNKSDNVVEPTNTMPPDSISYNQYLLTIKSQVNFAKTVHDMLIEGAKRITQIDLPMPVMPSTTPSTNASVV